MNKEIGEKWVAALRSGEYEQYTTGGLKSPVCDNRMCCLGVLADLYAKEHDGVEWDASFHKPKFMGQYYFIPAEVQEWAGLDSDNPLINYGYYHGQQEYDIAFLNDSGQVTFDKLADLIEEQLIKAEAAP